MAEIKKGDRVKIQSTYLTSVTYGIHDRMLKLKNTIQIVDEADNFSVRIKGDWWKLGDIKKISIKSSKPQEPELFDIKNLYV